MRALFFVAFMLPFTLTAPVKAQDYKTLLDVPAGQTLMTLSATETVKVEQDLLVATLEYQVQDKDQRALQDKINEVMKKAVAHGKAYGDVKLSTQQYYVYPYDYDPNPRPYPAANPKTERSWRGQQGLQIESRNAEQLLKLAGELQALGLNMNGLNYIVSTELMQKTQDSLMEAALQRLTAKADRAAKALGKTQASLVEVNLDNGGNYAPPMMRTMAMGAEMAMAKMDAPVAEAGEDEISLTVTATALLK